MNSSLVHITVWSLLLAPVAGAWDITALGGLKSVLWMREALEYPALTRQTYALAARQLPALMQRPGFASLETGPAVSGRAAVVLDLDETVLDTTAFNAALIWQGRAFTETAWQEWMRQGEEQAVAGALEFIQSAVQQGAEVFYVTNRLCQPVAHDPCPAKTRTMVRMAKLGFPRSDDPRAFLLAGERPDWGSDKTTRRRYIAQTHRIVLLAGDDLGDFLPKAVVETLRREPVGMAQYAHHFGDDWFLLPNPLYGSWLRALPADPTEQLERLGQAGANRAPELERTPSRPPAP
jgi:acid phosphatase